MTLYVLFLGIKGLLNISAGITAGYLGNPTMAGFWVLVGCADLWIAWWGLQ